MEKFQTDVDTFPARAKPKDNNNKNKKEQQNWKKDNEMLFVINFISLRQQQKLHTPLPHTRTHTHRKREGVQF